MLLLPLGCFWAASASGCYYGCGYAVCGDEVSGHE